MNAALVIQPDGSITKLPDLELATLQEAVGGYVQAITLQTYGEEVTAWVNEEGKMHDLPYNHRATLFCHGNLFAGDFIAGPMIVSGGTDAIGVSLPITKRVAETIKSQP